MIKSKHKYIHVFVFGINSTNFLISNKFCFFSVERICACKQCVKQTSITTEKQSPLRPAVLVALAGYCGEWVIRISWVGSTSIQSVSRFAATCIAAFGEKRGCFSKLAAALNQSRLNQSDESSQQISNYWTPAIDLESCLISECCLATGSIDLFCFPTFQERERFIRALLPESIFRSELPI